jgi:hypothetical protein
MPFAFTPGLIAMISVLSNVTTADTSMPERISMAASPAVFRRIPQRSGSAWSREIPITSRDGSAFE